MVEVKQTRKTERHELTHAAFQASRRCNGTAEILPSVSKVAGVWRNLSWCLESVMLWRGIMGFTKFGDKCVNDLDLLYVVGVACLHRENSCSGSACTSPPVRLDHLFFTFFFARARCLSAGLRS